MPVSASYRGSWAPHNVSNQVKGACPLWGQQKFHKRNFCGGLDNDMGMDIAAERKCPCPLWGQDFLTGQVENLGDKTMRNLRSRLVRAIAGIWHLAVIAIE